MLSLSKKRNIRGWIKSQAISQSVELQQEQVKVRSYTLLYIHCRGHYGWFINDSDFKSPSIVTVCSEVQCLVVSVKWNTFYIFWKKKWMNSEVTSIMQGWCNNRCWFIMTHLIQPPFKTCIWS